MNEENLREPKPVFSVLAVLLIALTVLLGVEAALLIWRP